MVAETTPQLQCEQVLRQARDALARGRFVEAREGFRRAFEEASRAEDPRAMSVAVLGLGGIWVNERRGPDEYLEYREQLQRSLHAAAGGPADLRALLEVRLAAEACYAEGAPLANVRAAVEAARECDDPATTAEALSLFHHLLLAPHDRVEREEVARALVLSAASLDMPTSALMGLVWNTVDAFLAGDREAPRWLARLRVRARELDHAAILFLVDSIELMLWLRAGRISEVENALPEVHGRGIDAGEVDATPWMAGQLLAVRWLQGRQHEVLDAARSLADSPDLTRFNRVYPAVWAAFAASAGAHDEARVALARVDPFGEPSQALPPSSMWLVTMFAVVEAIRHLDDGDAAAQAYEMLAPFADLPLIGSLAIVCFGSAHRSLAWCAAVSGDVDHAIDHFRQAIDSDLVIGNLPMLAVTRAELAAALTPTDRNAADQLYRQAIESGTQFGMVRWVEQWDAQRDAIHDTPAQREHGRWCQRGKTWEVEAGATRVVVPHSIGMAMIRVLLSSPYCDVPVEALTGAPLTPTRQTVLDARARDDLRRRISELQRNIEHADAAGDMRRSVQLSEELEKIRREIASNVGPSGVTRAFVTPTERARTSVQKAIRRALERIDEQAPELAEKLRQSIRTGTYCRFQPTSDLPSTWTTNMAGP
jgi:hypothetical protein